MKIKIDERNRKEHPALCSSALLAALWPALRGIKLGCDVIDSKTGEILIPANRRICRHLIIKLLARDTIELISG